MKNPLVSVVIGTFDRYIALHGLLAALFQQTHQNWEAIVCDESVTPPGSRLFPFADARIHWFPCGPKVGDWHRTAKLRGAQERAKGDYLMFPQDDVYYVPAALEMMVAAAQENDWALTYCHWLNPQEGYIPWQARPVVGHIDIGGFMVRRDLFNMVPWASGEQTGDGQWVEDMVAIPEVRHGEVPRVLYVKN